MVDTSDGASCLMMVAAESVIDELMTLGTVDVVVTSVAEVLAEDTDEHLLKVGVMIAADTNAAEMAVDVGENNGTGDAGEGVGVGDLSAFLVLLFAVI